MNHTKFTEDVLKSIIEQCALGISIKKILQSKELSWEGFRQVLRKRKGVREDYETAKADGVSYLLDCGIENIQKTVASYFTISLNEMLSPRRSRSLVRPRQIAMYLAKKLTTKSLPDIGRQFNNRDHTTVIHAVKKIDELIRKDNEIRQNILEIKKKFL